MTLFNLLAEPLRWIPVILGSWVSMMVSMTRIQNFLLVDELNPQILKKDEASQYAFRFDEASLSWGLEPEVEEDKKKKKKKKKISTEQQEEEKKEEEEKLKKKEALENTSLQKLQVLSDLDISIKKGEFVCIVGDVGSGKSSILSSLVGDLVLLEPSLKDNFSESEKLSKD